MAQKHDGSVSPFQQEVVPGQNPPSDDVVEALVSARGVHDLRRAVRLAAVACWQSHTSSHPL